VITPMPGGDRVPTLVRYPSIWLRLKRGLRLSGDLLTMLPWTLMGQTTITDGSGIIKKFETAFSRFTGSAFALAMTNGTATLHSAYFALGVGPGTEVIVPSYTWHASATPVLQCGATPVFCDIDPHTLTADPDDIERRITSRTKAICVVHVWGNPADMDRIMQIANRRGIKVIEDCSHAHGAVYKGKSVGTWGAIGCFSLNSGKAVDAGEAGVAVTDDPVLFDHMLLLGHFGRIQNGQAARTFNVGDMSLGMKYRPHTAAIHLAMASLKRLDELNARSEETWHILCEEIEGVAGIRPQVTMPKAVRGGFMAFVFVYEGQELGGPPREQFVETVRVRGAPLSADRYSQINYTYGMLHQAPLFTSLDRRALGGGCYDPTRPWQDLVAKVSLPTCERVSQQLVSFPRLDQISPKNARSFGRILREVLMTVVPQSTHQHYAVESVPTVVQRAAATAEGGRGKAT
jgi:perosamine synthetase